MFEILSCLVMFTLLISLLTPYVTGYKRYKNKKSKTNLFVDNEQGTMFISPGYYITDDDLKEIVSKYNDIYKIKIVDKDTVITGISKYVVDYTRDKKGSN